MPEITLQVLEALKLYLNIPKLIFVVGVDDKVVNALVREHYKPRGLSEAIERAIALHCDYVEVDVRETKDGRLVLMHDATVNRTTNGSGRVDAILEVLNFLLNDG